MREDGEAAPLLRGRPAGGQQEAGPSSAQQRAGVGEDCDHAGDRSRFVSRRLPPSALLTRARSHPLLLAVAAVAAVAATVLVIGAGMRSTSEQGVGRGGGDMSLAAAPGSSGADAREEGRAALDLAGRGEGGVGGGGTGRGGSSSGASSGGWRSQAARAQGKTDPIHVLKYSVLDGMYVHRQQSRIVYYLLRICSTLSSTKYRVG